MLDDFINPLRLATDYIDRISKGDIPEKITEEYKGDFNNIKNNLNNCIDEMGVLVDEVGGVIKLSREGNLAQRANPDRTKGVYRKILRGINDALDALINPLNVTADYVDKISKGDIPEKIADTYNGDFNNIKNNLNRCIEAINGVTGEMGGLANAVAEGILTKRGNTEGFHGVYQEMIQGMNGLIDSIADPLEELRICFGKMAVNDLTKKVASDYLGVWNDLKNAANDVHGRLAKILQTVTHISDGDLSDLVEYKRVGHRSENDNLMPAFIKLLESTNQMAEAAQSIADGNLSVQVNIRSEKDVLAKSLANMINELNNLAKEMTLLTKAGQEGKLQVRGGCCKIQGGL